MKCSRLAMLGCPYNASMKRRMPPMPFNRSLFSSQTCEWATPVGLVTQLEAEFGRFDFDPCASPANAKAAAWQDTEQAWSGLAVPWRGKVWLNPPYGRVIGEWVKKAYEESLKGSMVVCLLPSRTDTAWWHDYVMKADEIRFIRGRLRFGDARNSAPFPSAIAIFG